MPRACKRLPLVPSEDNGAAASHCLCDVLSGRKRVIRKAASSSPQQECARAPRPCYRTLEHTKRIGESGIHHAACLIERTVATSIVQHMCIHVTYQTTFKLSHALPAAQSRDRQNLGFWCTHAHILTRVMGRAAATFCGRHVMAESSTYRELSSANRQV